MTAARRLSRGADRRRRSALVRDICAATRSSRSACSPIPTSPRAQDRSRREFSLGAPARDGVGHWIKPAPIIAGPLLPRGQEGPPVRALQAMLALYGYGARSAAFTTGRPLNVAAFQRHFRPARVDGEADFSTIDTLQRLIEGLERE